MKNATCLLLLFFTISVAHAEPTLSVKVTETEYGDKWPFTVPEGIIYYEPVPYPNPKVKLAILTFKVGDKIYALNGLASSRIKQRGYLKIDEIWKPDPEIPGTKISVSPIIDRGLKLGEKETEPVH